LTIKNRSRRSQNREKAWEINPYFSMPVGDKGFLAGPRRLGARNQRNYDAMETYLEGLIAG
jgi:hypothetical protein